MGRAQRSAGYVGGPRGEVWQRQGGAGAAAGAAVPVAEPGCGVGVKEACVAAGYADVVAVQVVGAFQCVAGVADGGADVVVFMAVVEYGSGCGAADSANPPNHLARGARLPTQYRVQLALQFPVVRAQRSSWAPLPAVSDSDLLVVRGRHGDGSACLAGPRGLQPPRFGMLGGIQQSHHGTRQPPCPLRPVTGLLHDYPPPVDPRQMARPSAFTPGCPL